MLKKCVAIMALFALIAGAAFAEVTIGGQLQIGTTLLSGSNINDTDVKFGGKPTGDAPYHEAKFTGLFGDGTAGGRLVFNTRNNSMWGWLQWRPNQYFRVKIGSDGDGEGGFPQIVGWGFTGEAKNSVGAVSDYNGSLAMRYRNAGLNYGAFDGAGNTNLMFSGYLLDGLLDVNLLFRDIDKDLEISEKFARAQLYAAFKVEEVGTIRFAFQGNGGLMKDAPDGADYATLWLAFHSSQLVPGLGFEIGGNYTLPRKDDGTALTGDKKFTVNSNANVALGVNLTTITDPFNLKLRTNIAFGGKERYFDGFQEQTQDLPFGWGIGILPSYKLPKLTIFLHAGMGLERTPGAKNDDGELDEIKYNWFVNPYIWVPMGSMRMWVGVQIIDDHAARGDDKMQFTWQIPFGFNFYF